MKLTGLNYIIMCHFSISMYLHAHAYTALTALTSAESVSSLLESKLFATTRGHSVSGLPPSLLTVSCSLGEEERNLSLDIGRPVKLSLTRGLIERTVDFVVGLEELVLHLLNGDDDNDVSTDSKPSSKGNDDDSSKVSDDKMASSTSFLSKILDSEVSISTSQMLFELKLSTVLLVPPISREQSVSAEDCLLHTQDEIASTNSYLLTPSSSLKEGLLAGWEGLVITVPLTEQKGDLNIDGMQLLSVCEGTPYFIVPPLQLHCALGQHLYTHDLYVYLLARSQAFVRNATCI